VLCNNKYQSQRPCSVSDTQRPA